MSEEMSEVTNPAAFEVSSQFRCFVSNITKANLELMDLLQSLTESLEVCCKYLHW